MKWGNIAFPMPDTTRNINKEAAMNSAASLHVFQYLSVLSEKKRDLQAEHVLG